MDYDALYSLRQKEKDIAAANGFWEGDPELNGEFNTLRAMVPHFSCLVDVGANDGSFFSQLRASGSLSYALAFEPTPHLVRRLQARGQYDEILDVALGDSIGTTSFFVSTKDDTTSSVRPRTDMMPRFSMATDEITVVASTLDTYSERIIERSGAGAFIKIDVEGNEVPVLRGAQALLQQLERAMVMFEFSTAWTLGGHELQEAFHILDRLDYAIYRVLPIGLEHLRFYVPSFEQLGYCNYFAVKGLDLTSLLESAPLPSTTHRVNNLLKFA